MGYNTSFAVIHDTTLDELGADPGTSLTFEEATSVASAGVAASQVGPHVVLVDPFYGVSAKPVASRLGRQIYVVSLGSTASTYAIEAEGAVHRVRAVSNGDLLADEGAPLPAEDRLAEHQYDEEAHLAVFGELLGRPLVEVGQATFHPMGTYLP